MGAGLVGARMKELHDNARGVCRMRNKLNGTHRERTDIALVQRVIDEIWNAGQNDLADDLFAVTYVNHGGLVSDLVQGPEGIKVGVALFRAAFPDLHISVDSLSAIEGIVQLHWTAMPDSRGGPADAVSARHSLTGETKSSVVDGRIAESWTSWDSTAALQRLGVFQPGHEETS